MNPREHDCEEYGHVFIVIGGDEELDLTLYKCRECGAEELV
jgi:hypothetical protein